MEGQTSVTLQSRDRLLIKSIPEFARAKTIQLNGEVRYPGQYTIRNGETLRNVIERAGGLTENAFPEGAVFTRENSANWKRSDCGKPKIGSRAIYSVFNWKAKASVVKMLNEPNRLRACWMKFRTHAPSAVW